MPVAILVAALVLLVWKRKEIATEEKRFITLMCCMVLVMLFWLPTATPSPFLRYLICLAPICSVLSAWVLVKTMRRFAWVGIGLLVLTTVWSAPFELVFSIWNGSKPTMMLRPDLVVLFQNVFGHQHDPNRETVEWLKAKARPSDEILINYEDIPLMFYLPNPIRGGLPGFRVNDNTKGPPRFVVMRQSIGFCNWPVFEKELSAYQYRTNEIDAPDIPWGNSPDPIAINYYLGNYPRMQILELKTADTPASPPVRY